MSSTDARPIPRKNTAFRVTFPLLDADGDLVTGASSLDSEVSIDGGTFSDCTNEATEIATSSGMYYLDLTSSEMNGDTVAVIVKSASAKTLPLVFYPEEAGDVRVDVVQISGDSTAADNCELMFDGTGYAGGTSKLGVDVVAISGDSAAADNLETATDGGSYNIGGGGVVAASVTGAVGSVTGAVASVTGAVGSVTGSVGSVAAGGITASSIATGAVDADALAADAVDEILDEVVEGSTTLRQAIRLLLSFIGAKVSGGGSTTITFRDIGDTKNRITMTVDADGDRSAVTLDGS